MQQPDHSHGHSTAAWTTVTILLVAASLIALAVVFASWPLAIAGLILLVVGVAVGKFMSMAGIGQSKSGPSAAGRSAH